MSIAYKALAGLLLLLGVFGVGLSAGHHAEATVMQAKIATLQKNDALALAAQSQALAKQQVQALHDQQAAEQRIATITQTYEQEQAHAKQTADDTIASLRAGTLRLRSEWSCTPQLATSVQHAAASGLGSDASAQLRLQDASDLVRFADDADAQIRALQAIVTSDRK